LEREPLNVLLLSNTDPVPFVQGADRDWVNLLNAIGPEHLRVTWVGLGGTARLRDSIDRRVLVRTVDIEEQPCLYEVVPDNAHAQRSHWLWAKIIGASTLDLARSYRRLRRALGREPIDLVVTNTVVVLLGAFFARLTGRPHVWNIKEHLDPRVDACRRFARLVNRYSSAVVVPSKIIGEAFGPGALVLPDGGDLERIRVSVKTGREEVLRSLGLPSNLPLVAQAGAITQRKGQHLTAEAFVRLAREGGPPTFSLAFFGQGDSETLERLDATLSQAPPEWRAVVRFSSFGSDDLSPLGAADVLVHPSVFHDAFPNAVREAMTLGKPVIASAMGGMTDMIVDGENGLLVRPGDAEALASAIERLVGGAGERRRLGEAARAFAEQNFDIHVRKLAYLDLMTRLARPAAGVSGRRAA